MHLEDALIQCRMSPKKSAKICEKVGGESRRAGASVAAVPRNAAVPRHMPYCGHITLYFHTIQVLLSAKANAMNNHGLDESRLTVGECRHCAHKHLVNSLGLLLPPSACCLDAGACVLPSSRRRGVRG